MTWNKRIIASLMFVVFFQGVILPGAGAMELNEFHGRYYSLYVDGSTFAARLNSDDQAAGDTAGSRSGLSDINWHKVFGWTTIAAGAATFAALGFGSKDVHCGLAYFSTAMAATTCITGYYSYYDVLGSDLQYTIHATVGTLATIGFGTALALADGGPHAAVGAGSGIAFVVSVGTLFF